MGKELEERLIRTHQPEKLQRKGREGSNLLNDLVNCQITLGGAQGLVSQTLKQEHQLSKTRYRNLDQEIKGFSLT